MRRHGWLLLAILVGVLAPGVASAERWAGIEPGVTTMPDVRARLGPPSREVRKKVDNYDTIDWVYEGSQAPVGFFRMTVEFGVLVKDTFNASLVRLVRVDPKPFIFSQPTVLEGWGPPDGVGEQAERLAFFYNSGLIVIFDEDKIHAVSMLFTMPQVLDPNAPIGARPPGAAAPAAPGAAPASPGAAPASPGAPPASPGAPPPRR